ncbi:MAG: PEP-CTERM system histidine kinase PrsK [Burkholderiales bacterium]|nr:MAG: PEP-CTERM system histidine kinase PrsK [Burkholderiales bacterium]
MDPRSLGILGFGAAALAWLALAGLLTVRRTADATGRLLLAAVAVQVAWAGTMALALVPVGPAVALAGIFEALRGACWIVLLLRLIPSSAGLAAGADDPIERTRRTGLVLVTALAAASIAVDFLDSGLHLVFTTKTVMAVAGLVCLEQAYRNTPHARRWALKFMAIALAAMFGFDLLMYSDAMLYARMNAAWWVTRGFANALLVPLMAIAAARNPQWKLDIGVSREVVFHSAALFVAGAYLVLVAGGGYYIRYFGGAWGEIAQTLIVFAALVGLLAAVASGAIRARLRVFLSKHFFSYRFDYRNEWLRLTRTLSGAGTDGESQDLPSRVIRALAQPVESPGGALWLREGGAYRCVAAANYRGSRPMIDADAPLADFLRDREWVIDVNEWRAHRERYDGLSLPGELHTQDSAWLIVPLMLERELVGFAILERPLAPLPLDWEVRDLLKTAARQAASYVGVQRAVEELVQARQFESFNRMSAFVVHDLKNLVAQLALMTKNAQRHRDNPEFQADMLDTVRNVMERMQGLLLQLRAGARPVEAAAPVPLAQVLAHAVAAKRGLRPEPEVAVDETVAQRSVLAHRDRLERVIGHLVQNAAEASGPSGMICVRARRDGADALIEVEDNGKGMSDEFMRSRLFRPFVSTKAHGMGIGTFESREYVRELGGSLEVSSREGAGTVFTIRLPLVGDERTLVSGA